MLTIILGIVLTVGIIIIYFKTDFELLAYAAALIFMLTLAIGIAYPVAGYKEWKMVKEVELVSLNNGIGAEGNLFATTSNGEYAFRYEIDSEFGTSSSKEYRIEVLSSDKVEEVQDPNCTKPYLYKYERKGKRNIWCLAVFGKQIKYVLYVPEGTIQEKIELK